MNLEDKKVEFLNALEPINDKLFAYAKALEKDYDEAQDLVSEAILSTWENFDKIKDKNSFKAFIFQVTRNKYFRKKRRLAIFSIFDDEKAETIPTNSQAPDLGPDVELLYKVLDTLPIKQKEALVLFEISGFSLEEIKNIQGGSLSGVKSRLTRGREALKELLVDKEYAKSIKINEIITSVL